MHDIPPEWREYERLQQIALRQRSLNAYSWGIENALDRQLDQLSANPAPSIGTATRRERRRAKLREVHLQASCSPPIRLEALDATGLLKKLQAAALEEWKLLLDLAHGWSYRELAAAGGERPEVLRARASRARRRLRRILDSH